MTEFGPNALWVSQFPRDAGGRDRVSQVTTLFDGKTIDGDDALIWENVGTGAGAFADNKYGMVADSGEYLIRRGRHVCPYYSGKSQIIELTMDFFAPETGVVKRAGYFSSSSVAPYDAALDGFWIESGAAGVELVVSSNGTERLRLPVSQWDNGDLFADYDWDDFTVVVFDFLWLGGTSLRLFFATPKGFVLAHTFAWASLFQGTFILSPSQSVRYEVRGVSSSGGMRAICSQVASEGSVAEAGRKLSVYSATARTAATANVIYPLKGVRKVAGFEHVPIRVTGASVAATGVNDAGLYFVLLNPTLSAPLTWTALSRIEEGTATTQTVTNVGRVLFSASALRAGGEVGLDDNFLSSIGTSAAGVSDQIILAYMPITANQSVYGTMTVKEV